MDPFPPNNTQPPEPTSSGVHPLVQSLREDVVRFPTPQATPFHPARGAQSEAYQQASASSSLSSIQTPFSFPTHTFEQHESEGIELPHMFCEDLWSIQCEILDYEESLLRKVRRMVKEKETLLLQQYHERVDRFHELMQHVFLSAEGRTAFRQEEDPELWNLQQSINIVMATNRDASFLFPGNQLLTLPAFVNASQDPELHKLWFRIDPVHRAFICLREDAVCLPPFASFSRSDVEGQSTFKQGLIYYPHGPESLQLHLNLLIATQDGQNPLPDAYPLHDDPGLTWVVQRDQNSPAVQEELPVASPPPAQHAQPAPSASSTSTPSAPLAPSASSSSEDAPAQSPPAAPALQPDQPSSTQASPTAAPVPPPAPSTISAPRSEDSHQAKASQSTSTSSVPDKLRAYLELGDLKPVLEKIEEAPEELEDQEDGGDREDRENQQDPQDQQDQQEQQDQQDQQDQEEDEKAEDAGAGEAKPLTKRQKKRLKSKIQADQAKLRSKAEDRRLAKENKATLERYAPLQEVTDQFEEYLKIYAERTLAKRMNFLSFAVPARRDFSGMEDDIVDFFSKDAFILNSPARMMMKKNIELRSVLFNKWGKSGDQHLEVLSLVLQYLHVSELTVAKQDLHFLTTTNLSEAALVPALERYYSHVRAVSRLPPPSTPEEWTLSLVPKDFETFKHGLAQQYIAYFCAHMKRMHAALFVPSADNDLTEFETKVMDHLEENKRKTLSLPPNAVREFCNRKGRQMQQSGNSRTKLAGKMWSFLTHFHSTLICHYVTCVLHAEALRETTAPLKNPRDVILMLFNFDRRP